MRARAAIGHIKWRLRIWIAVAVALGCGLCFVPLFGVLGYELAVATSIVGTVMGLDLGAAYARALARLPARPETAGRAVARGTVAAVGLATAIGVIPAIICAIHGLWAPTCDWRFGIEAYLAMTLASTALAAALGHALGALVGPRRFAGAIVAQLPFVLLLGAALWRFYAAPAVFNYTPIVGYFPGNLYDENLHLGAPLAWARLEQLAWVIGILALVATRLDAPSYRVRLAPRPIGMRVPALVIATVAFAIGAGLYHTSGAHGYRVDADDIIVELDGRIETPHFVIHYAHTKEIDADIQLIANDHEFRYAQVVAQLGVAPAGKLTSFYFSDRDQKARLMGARDVEMAKPWRHEIYLDHQAWPDPSLRHEIAHAVAAAFGDPLFHVASRRVLGLPLLASPGLIEGLAVAVDWPGRYDRPTPHESVRALQAMGVTPTIDELLSLRFFGVSSARGYTTAGSFLKYLLDTYGAAPLRDLYESGGDFEGAYHQSMRTLEAEWLRMIAKIVLPRTEVDANRERFRGTSVFDRPCPHAVAARREQAVGALADGDRPRAIDLMRHVCGDAPEEPRYRMELGDFLVAGDRAEHAEALRIWTALAHDAEHVTSSLRVEAYERLARTIADYPTLRAVLGEATVLPIDAGERRQLDAELFALDRESPAGSLLRMYFFARGHGIDPRGWAMLITLVEPSLGFGHYLLGLQLQNGATPEWGQAATELAMAIRLRLPNAAFAKNAARRLAIAAYRTRRWWSAVNAQLAIDTLRGPEMTTADHLLGDDWAARFAAHMPERNSQR